MEQYLTFTDHDLWEVIVNVDSITAVESASAEGPISPKTAKQKLARKNELKAKSTLMLVIPNEHLLKFYACKDEKSLWEAIKDSLPSAWNNIALIMRNKSDLDTLSMNAFVSFDNTSSTNETVNTAHNVSAASSKDQASTASYADDVMFSFFSNQSNAPQLDNEDLEQIDDDLEEIDLKWQVAMLTMRVKRAPRNQENRNRDDPKRNALVDTSTINALTLRYISSDSKVHTCSKEGLKSYNALRKHYDQQREVLNKSNLEIIGYQIGLESLEARIVIHEKNEAIYEEDIAFLKYDFQVKDISIKDLKNQLENALKEKDDLKLKLEKFETSSKNLTKLIDSQISATDKTGLGYDGHVNESEMLNNVVDSYESDGDDNQVNDRFKKIERYHAVPPPYIRNYMPPRANLFFAGLDDSIFKSKVSETITSVSKIETNASKTSKDSLEKPKTVRSSAPIIEDCKSDNKDKNVFESKEVKKTIKPSLEKIEFVNARNTTIENENKAKKPRKFSQSPSDYQEIDGGFVAFGRNAKGGKIPRKGKIRTGKLDFEDVYFMKDIKFNLFSVSQMCDKKNSVLFTDTECVVLSPEFKLLDGSQVLLKVSKNNNMYSFELKNVVPVGGIENQMDHKVKTIKCDNGTEFKNKIMNEFCKMKGPKSLEDEVDDDARKKSTNVPRKENRVQDLAKEGKAANTNSTNKLTVSSSFTTVDPGREKSQRNEFESMFEQDKDANDNRIFNPVSATGSTYIYLKDTTDLQDSRIFIGAYDDEVEGAEADFNNFELTTVRVFRYLKGQPKLGLWYPGDSPFYLEAFLDSDYAGASLDRKSTTRACQFLRKRLISWKCKKQIVVANSRIKVEYVAAANCCRQIRDLVDRNKIIVTKAFIRRDLQLKDAECTACLPNDNIFEELAKMSAKTAAWNEFNSTMAFVIIFLANNKKFNFSKYIFDNMVKNLEAKVLDLEKAKTAQAKEIADLKKKVKKLERKKKSRTSGLKRLWKGRMINNIDQNKEITLVDETQERMNEEEMFGVNDLDGDEVIVDATAGEEVEQSTKVAEKEVSTTDLVTTAAKDKGKGIMVEPEKPLKKKDQIAFDEDVARKLEAQMKAEMEEEEMIAKEKDEANIDLFDLVKKRINIFVDMNTSIVEERSKKTQAEVTECSFKRAGDELEQESAKRQRLEKEDDSTKLKRCLKIVPEDDDDVTIEATPLSLKSPTIVDFKIYKEVKESYFKIIRADENS
nr:uncharacterized mitochondrial protein AtMg00810-like [Tanacetum cinerariifolium]